jgi:tetratricopeptide (TPR) repeat protein
VAAQQDEPREPSPEQIEALVRTLRTVVDSALVDSLARGGAPRVRLSGPGIDSLRQIPRVSRPGDSRPGIRPQPLPPRQRHCHSLMIEIESVRADSIFAPFRAHLEAGDLAAARRALDRVAERSRQPMAREIAEFDLIELDFFEAQFDSALVAYRAFAIGHPRGYLTNDAIARMFLIDDNSDVDRKPLILFAAAQQQSRAGRPDSARVLLERAIERYAGSSLEDDLLMALGDTIIESDPEAAIGSFQRVADSLPESPLAAAALIRIGRHRAEVGRDLEAAISVYERVLERFPDSIEADEARRRIERLRRRT